MTAPTTICAAAALFDMDGTLVDSTAVVEEAWGRFAARHGIPLPELLAFSHGRQARDTLARFLPAGADLDGEAAALHAWELEHTDGIREIPGASALLRALPQARVAVVTSAPRALAVLRIRAAGLEVPRVLVTAEDVRAGKPDPAGYLRAAGLLGVAAENAVVFEDAPAGLLAGIASGARTVVVGADASDASRGLDRIADFSGLVVDVGSDSAFCLTLADAVHIPPGRTSPRS